MSADNGVYILETPRGKRKEYRVQEMQAVENYLYDERTMEETSDPDVHIHNARQMWKDCKVYTDEGQALSAAAGKLKKLEICEYGICFIEIPREF